MVGRYTPARLAYAKHYERWDKTMNQVIALLAFLLPFFALLIPIVALLTRYQLERLKLQAKHETESVAQLRQALEDLRETTTQYDLAMDQTLQRIERRLEEIENRVAQLEQGQSQQLLR